MGVSTSSILIRSLFVESEINLCTFRLFHGVAQPPIASSSPVYVLRYQSSSRIIIVTGQHLRSSTKPRLIPSHPDWALPLSRLQLNALRSLSSAWFFSSTHLLPPWIFLKLSNLPNSSRAGLAVPQRCSIGNDKA